MDLCAPVPDAAAWTAALGRLADQRGLTLGALQRRRGPDLDVVLGLAAAVIGRDETIDEFTVNRRLADWLDTVGTMLRGDAAELRRRLVDGGWWQRRDGGRGYWRVGPAAGAAGQALDAFARDAPALLHAARQARAMARAAGVARHAGTAPPA